jgi:trehalose 6-phosphate synthase/phosphatase
MRGGMRAFKTKLASQNCYPVFLSKNQVDNFYRGFSNRTIWPLFHYFPLYTVYDKNWWGAYRRVNELFCDAVLKVVKSDDILWIHDYHLMLLPELIRERIPDATIGFFLHIPFPSSELFRLLPWGGEILEGILGADLIGFHTHDYVHHFVNSVRRILGYDNSFGEILFGDRVVRADTFPMGIDYDRFSKAVGDPETARTIQRIRKQVGNRSIVLSIDRLDYTKGILQRLRAFDLFLQKNPRFRGKVTLIQVTVPSRTGVETYKLLKRELDELVGRINGKHGAIGWAPVWYLHRSVPFHTLVALYHLADVALVTPLRDGMNLIAKEYIATKTDRKGVLILSAMAGSSSELGEAIIVNPNDIEAIAESLKEALEMGDDEQIERNWGMQKRLERYDTARWANDFMERLLGVKRTQSELLGKRFTSKTRQALLDDYGNSTHRLLLLDYDGTVVSFREKPERVKPDKELVELLGSLSKETQNEVIVISGRDRSTLGLWFNGFNIGMVAEHGVWFKEKGGSWKMVEPLRNDWKAEIRPILELYVDRTPGSFIEEKEFSLVWHYRKANPELAEVRARELKESLLQLTSNLNLGVLEGAKVMEIKSVGVDKGRAARRWLSKNKWDFILAMGDDWTDEDTFAVLPESAYSIKVGLGSSRARFNLDSVTEARSLLGELVEE